jgi:hypothetical protein
MVCKCHTVTFCPEICAKMFIFKVDVQSDYLETKCSWVKVSQGKNVTVDVSSGSKCYSGRNVGGRNVKASWITEGEKDANRRLRPECRSGTPALRDSKEKSSAGGAKEP